MKKKQGVRGRMCAAAALLLIVCLLASCAAAPKSRRLGFGDVLPLLGADRETVWEKLDFGPEKIEPFTGDGTEEYVFEQEVGGSGCTVSLFFPHDVLAGFQYVFPDAETVFSYAKQIRQALGEDFGEPATQPIDSEVQHRFDSVGDAGGLSPLELYYEDWTPETDGKQMEKMLGGEAVKRIDVRFSVYMLESGGIISVRYSPIPAEAASAP